MRALAISKRQAQTLLRAAEAERGIVEVNPHTGVITLIPAALAQLRRRIDAPSQDSFETLEDYLAWRDGSAGEN